MINCSLSFSLQHPVVVSSNGSGCVCDERPTCSQPVRLGIDQKMPNCNLAKQVERRRYYREVITSFQGLQNDRPLFRLRFLPDPWISLFRWPMVVDSEHSDLVEPPPVGVGKFPKGWSQIQTDRFRYIGKSKTYGAPSTIHGPPHDPPITNHPASPTQHPTRSTQHGTRTTSDEMRVA